MVTTTKHLRYIKCLFRDGADKKVRIRLLLYLGEIIGGNDFKANSMVWIGWGYIHKPESNRQDDNFMMFSLFPIIIICVFHRGIIAHFPRDIVCPIHVIGVDLLNLLQAIRPFSLDHADDKEGQKHKEKKTF